MANSYSSNLRLIIQTTGTNQGLWGDYTNTNIATLLEQAITGIGAIAVSGSSNYTLSTANGASDESRNAILNVTGTLTAAINIVCPTVSKTYIIKNGTTGGFAVTLKTSAGTGISVPNGSTMFLYCDGTNVVEGLNSVGSLVSASGLYAKSTFSGTYTDGIVVDYTTGTGRFSVGTSDGFAWYNGGVATTSLLTLSTAGVLATIADATIYGITVGRGAGAVSTNTAVGASALAANTTGNAQTAYGYNALFTNTSGAENTAIGYNALYYNTSGANNVAIGRSALVSNTTASYNNAVGYQALYSNTTGSQNVAMGYQTYAANTTGLNGVAIGHNALGNNTTGSYNTAIGHTALVSNTTASNNTAVGYQAGYSNTTGTITAVGYRSGFSNTTGDRNAYFGGPDGSFGYGAGYSNTTGSFNSGFGSGALGSATTASGNSAFGYQSLLLNTTGASNVAVGQDSLRSNTTASNNTAVGYQAGYSASTQSYNTFIGYQSGYTFNTGGTIGSYNCFVGFQAGYQITTGIKNTILGGYNGNQGGLDIRTASNYIVLSDGDGNPRQVVDNGGNVLFGGVKIAGNWDSNCWGFQYSGGGDGFVVQGHVSGSASGKAYIYFDYGNGVIGSVTQNGTTGVLFNTSSDIRLKINKGLTQASRIDAVKIHDYSWKSDGSNAIGAFAQELFESHPEAVKVGSDELNEDGNLKDPWAVDYSKLVPDLIVYCQQLKAELDALKSQIGTK